MKATPGYLEEVKNIMKTRIREIRAADARFRKQLSHARADRLAKNSDAIAKRFKSDPVQALKVLLKQAGIKGRDLPVPDPLPQGLTLEELKGLIARYGRGIQDFVGKITKPPRIIDFEAPCVLHHPDVIEVGCEYTIVGTRFGIRPGTLVLKELSNNHPDFPLTIRDWSDTHILFNVDDSLEGIPFDSEGTIAITTADGHGTTIRVFIIPATIEHEWFDTYSKSGEDNYSGEHVFCSGPLPASYQKHPIDEEGRCVAGDYNVDEWLHLWESGHSQEPVVDMIGETYVEGNKLRQRVKFQLWEDCEWRIEVSLRFFILIPKGILHDAGWD